MCDPSIRLEVSQARSDMQRLRDLDVVCDREPPLWVMTGVMEVHREGRLWVESGRSLTAQ